MCDRISKLLFIFRCEDLRCNFALFSDTYISNIYCCSSGPKENSCVVDLPEYVTAALVDHHSSCGFINSLLSKIAKP